MCSLLKKHLHWNVLNLICQKRKCLLTQRFLSVVLPNGVDVPVMMKGRFASQEQKRIISEFITESNPTKLDWDALKSSVLSINRGYINEKNINGCILETCSNKMRLDLAKSYMTYLENRGQTKPNIALQLLYIRSCYACRDQLTVEDKHEIKTICHLLFKNNSHLLNAVILEGLVMGLCCTPSWRECLEYSKVLNNERALTVNTNICIIVKAFEEAEIDLGWTLIKQMYNQNEVLPVEVFSAWFDLCEKNTDYKYQKVLEFLSDHECTIKVDLAELIREKVKQFGSEINTTVINHKTGMCTNCNQLLKPVEVTDLEFKVLQERFLSDVMIGKNIFINSSPQELKDFKDFIEMTAPYDVVIDGLNLAYAYRSKIANNSLTKIVLKTFIKQNLKILLVGRKHLVKMLGNEFNFVQKNVNLFFTNDLSKDDPFVLYAAMYSGPRTQILSRDLMRGHKFLLGDTKIKCVFQKWLQKNRLILKIRSGNEVRINSPLSYLQAAQKSTDGMWHLPYEEVKEPGTWSKPDSTPDNWMCIKTS